MLIFLIFSYLIVFNQSFKIKINESIEHTTGLSIDDLIELNNLLKSEIFISNITFTKTLLAIIKFNFSSNFKNLTQFYKLNKVQINIKHADKCSLCSSNHYLTKTLNLTVNNSQFNNFCLSEKDEVGNCYSSISTLSSAECILNNLSFKLNKTGLFFICIKFKTIKNPNLLIFTDNMCYNWEAENLYQQVEHHSFRYKPLFILLMYILCASILIPIAIFQHFVTNSKSKLKIKIDSPSNCDISDISNNGLTKNSSASSKNVNKYLLSPLIQPFHEKTKNEFNYKEMDQNFRTDFDEEMSNEADHILDDKPWMEKVDSVPDSNSTQLPKSISLELLDNKKIKFSASNLNVYFESNV